MKCASVAKSAVVSTTAPSAPPMVLFGLVLWRELAAPEQLARAVGEDVVQLHAEQDRELDRRAEPVIREDS